jgi:hypothetical protein
METASTASGHTVTITLSANTPPHILTYLKQLKESGERTYHNKLTQLFIESVQGECTKDKPHVVIPLPEWLSREQQDWFNHPLTQQMLTHWVLQFTNTGKLPAASGEYAVPHPEADIQDNSDGDPPSFQVSTSYHSKLVGFFIDED